MIRFVFRWAFRTLLLAVVLVIGVLLVKDTVLRNLAEERIRRSTGFDVKMGKLEFSLTAPRVTIENLVLYNPAEFGGSVFLDIAGLQIEYDREELAFRRVRLKLLRVELREVSIVQNQQDRTNIVDFLQVAAPATVGGPGETGGSGYKFSGVDLLNLSIAKVRYTHLRLPRRNQEVALNMRDEVVQNIRTEQDLVGILFKVLLRAGIPIYLEGPPPPPRA